MASTQPQQLFITFSQTGFTQTLAQTDNISSWSFPVNYSASYDLPAETAQITIDGTPTSLYVDAPNQSQTIKGSGQVVDLICEFGSKTVGVTINSNPYNQPDCSSTSSNTYPLISYYALDQDPENVTTQLFSFQIACAGESTSWELDVNLEFPPDDPESSPTSAYVSLFVDGSSYEQVQSGQSNYTPSGTTLGFTVEGLQGSGTIKLGYTLQAN